MDGKFYHRFNSYRKSLRALSEARNRDLSDSFVLSGTGAKFSITFDLAWKVMKDLVVQRFAIVDFPKGSPREVLRKAYEVNLISDDTWMEMLTDRNDLTHDYDGEVIEEICGNIIGKYMDLFLTFEETVQQLLQEGE